jgi:hypothetical protein
VRHFGPRLRFFCAPLLVVLLASLFFAECLHAQEPSLAAELRRMDALRSGDKTPLDEVEHLGADLLKQYKQPIEHAQIWFELAHVHAQSGLKQPAKIVEHARAALKTKLLTPAQRATLYSYLSSAHEVDREEKSFAARRRNSVQPLLEGLSELQDFHLPLVAPELPAVPRILRDVFDPVEAERAREEAETAQAARREAERVRELVWRQQVLKDQVKWLYARAPAADDELLKLAAKALDEPQAKALVAAAKAERDRVEQARQQRQQELDKAKERPAP